MLLLYQVIKLKHNLSSSIHKDHIIHVDMKNQPIMLEP